ncbi:MAG TPA: thioredoxin domain-containing protein [Fimbriimonas sp.]|nr:thioredoxin domain-containing protein [Fimbriimonas sp.]
MRRTFGLLALTGVAAAAFAALHASTLLTDFSKSIHDAKSIKTDYVYQEIGGLRSEYSVALKKPNLARIDSPDQLIVADGKNITTLDKKAKTYYKQPETDDLLNSLFTSDSLNAWSGFFNANAYHPTDSVDLGTKTRANHTYEAFQASADKAGNKLVTYFLDPSDKIARQVEIKLKAGAADSTFLLRTTNFDVNADAKDDLFTFSAPAGATEESLADVLGGKWFTSFTEAKKYATTNHRKIFIDFMATWCGPCKMLQNAVLDTEKFKKFAADKKLVLCRIDVDLNPDLAQKYSATEIPLQAVVDSDGNLLSKTVGYAGPEEFYSWINGAVGN